MQAVLLLAGANSRFFPLNFLSQKSMFPLYGKPLLEYVVQDLHFCGITSFIFVVATHESAIKSYFGDGSAFGVTITYAYLDEPTGQGDALLKAQQYVSGPFIIPNPYHTGERDFFKRLIDTFNEEKPDGLIPIRYEKNISEYGAVDFQDGKVSAIVEKPQPGSEPSHFTPTSAYIFQPDFLEYLEKQPKDHYSYEKAITEYAQKKNIRVHQISEDHTLPTLKYPWHILAFRPILSQSVKGFIHPSAHIASSAMIEPTAYVDEEASIGEDAHIKGSTYIGKHAYVGDYSLIRDSDIGDHAHVGVHADVARSIIMKEATYHGGGFIGDSIIGEQCKLAYGFTTANKRNDRTVIKTHVKDIPKSTDLISFGTVFGKGVRAGINVSTMPGVLVGSSSHIWPGVILRKNVKENSEVKPA